MTLRNYPITNSAELYMSGLVVSWLSGTTLSIAQGAGRDSSNTMDLGIGPLYPPLNGIPVTDPITVDATKIGVVNGLDVGSLANNTWYALYIIGDSSYHNPVGAILTLATNASPKMPLGYDSYRLRYYVKTDGTANILKFYMLASGRIVRNIWDGTINVLTAGSANVFTPINMLPGVPPSIGVAKIIATYQAGNVGNKFVIRPTGSTETTNLNGANSQVVSTPGLILQMECFYLLSGGNPSIDYKLNTADSLSINVLEWMCHL